MSDTWKKHAKVTTGISDQNRDTILQDKQINVEDEAKIALRQLLDRCKEAGINTHTS